MGFTGDNIFAPVVNKEGDLLRRDASAGTPIKNGLAYPQYQNTQYLLEQQGYAPPQEGQQGWTPPAGGPQQPLGGALGGGAGVALPNQLDAPTGGSSGPTGGGTGGGGFGAYNGGNQAFYNDQFSRLMGTMGANREASQAAAIRRQEAESQQQESTPFEADWSWADLPEVRTNSAEPGSEEAWEWILNPAYNAEAGSTTNLQLANMVGPDLNPQQHQWLLQNLQESGTADGTWWGQAGSPEAIYSNLGPGVHPDWAGTLRDFANTLYARSDMTSPSGGGPAAPPPGYAAPR